MSFISLPTGKLYKKQDKKRLKNFLAGYMGRFYRNLGNNVDIFLGSDFFQNPVEDVFGDVSTFDAKNPIVGSLLRELDVRKKDIACELIKKAARQPEIDFLIQNRQNDLEKNQRK